MLILFTLPRICQAQDRLLGQCLLDKRIKRVNPIWSPGEVVYMAHLCLETHAGDTSKQASKKPALGGVLPCSGDEDMLHILGKGSGKCGIWVRGCSWGGWGTVDRGTRVWGGQRCSPLQTSSLSSLPLGSKSSLGNVAYLYNIPFLGYRNPSAHSKHLKLPPLLQFPRPLPSKSPYASAATKQPVAKWVLPVRAEGKIRRNSTCGKFLGSADINSKANCNTLHIKRPLVASNDTLSFLWSGPRNTAVEWIH